MIKRTPIPASLVLLVRRPPDFRATSDLKVPGLVVTGAILRRGGRNARDDNAGQATTVRLIDHLDIFGSQKFKSLVDTGLKKIIAEARSLEIPCVREGFAEGSDMSVHTNHFAVKLPKTSIYQFQILGMNASDKKAPPRE